MLFLLSNDTPPTDIYTLSLHDALPISPPSASRRTRSSRSTRDTVALRMPSSRQPWWKACATRSEEHTSELQSHSDLVCRLLLEKKKKKTNRSANVPLTHE